MQIMEKKKTYQVKIAAIILLLLAQVASLLAGTVYYYVNDGESLKEYICPPSETLPPNTHVIINISSLSIKISSQFCRIENTSNNQ